MADRYRAPMTDARDAFDAIALSLGMSLATTVALTASILLVAAGGAMRFREIRPGVRWTQCIGLASGLSVGLLFVENASLGVEAGLFLVIAVFVTGWLWWRGRSEQAGIFAIGAALPWSVAWAIVLGRVLAVEAGQAGFDATAALLPLLAGLTGLAIGVGLVRLGDVRIRSGVQQPRHAARPRRVGLVAEALTTPEMVGSLPVSEFASLLGVFAAVVAIGVLNLPGYTEPLAQVAGGTLAGVELRLLVRPRRVRRAYEAFSWLGEWELERLRQLTGKGVPTNKGQAERWLADLPERPDTRWIRVEVLALLERVEEARAVAETMPVDTPYARFERAYAIDLADWMGGRHGDPESLQTAVTSLDGADAETLLRADAAMAVRETRLLVAEGGPENALGPLVGLRERLGSRADGQLRRALWRRTLPVSAVTAVIVTALMSPLP